jgi:hypothetical protein
MNRRLVKWLFGLFSLDQPRPPRLALPGDAESDVGDDPEAWLELIRAVDQPNLHATFQSTGMARTRCSRAASVMWARWPGIRAAVKVMAEAQQALRAPSGSHREVHRDRGPSG